jgi:hypothetical protein
MQEKSGDSPRRWQGPKEWLDNLISAVEVRNQAVEKWAVLHISGDPFLGIRKHRGRLRMALGLMFR